MTCIVFISLRENVNYLKQKYFPGISKSSHTVEFFPVEWRSSLVLDAGVIESITPQKILNIRQMLNASFMDIMYYNSPLYRDEVGCFTLYLWMCMLIQGYSVCMK